MWTTRGTFLTSLPPDEYHQGNDSVYTNNAVRAAVSFLLEAAIDLNVTLPANYSDRLQRLSNNLVITYDSEKDYHPEFAGYDGSLVKQADVVLLNFPWGMTMNKSTVLNDLQYYASRTDPNGPAMTWSMFAVGYFSIGMTEIGSRYFLRGYVNNSFPPFYQWSEVAGGGGCPNFLTGAGGFLQSIWAGLAGLRVQKGALIVKSFAFLPDTLSEVAIQRLSFLGSVLTIRVLRATNGLQVSVLVHTQGPGALRLNGNLLVQGIPSVQSLESDALISR